MNNQEDIVLVVEDIPSNHFLIERSLEKIGIRTIQANNGKEALSLYQDFSNNIKLILMDLRMPVMDGYQAIKEIRDAGFTLPIIAQTAYLMPYEKNLIINAGCNDLITKPFRSTEIINIVRKHL
ncbi:MAG: response regulator [Bacteroidales bacterium]|nr:response regulator [Bacteroidales bacterium]